MEYIGMDGQLHTASAKNPACTVLSTSGKVPFRCPVCEGRGHVPNGFYYATADTATQTCLACGGKGIIWSAS